MPKTLQVDQARVSGQSNNYEWVANKASKPTNIQEELFAKWKDKITLPLDEIDIKNPKHIALLNSQGMTFREIKRIFGVPTTSAFRKTKGVVSRNRYYTLMNVVCREYYQNRNLSIKQREEIRKWINQNASKLQEAEGTFYTMMQERSLLLKEESYYDLDSLSEEPGGDDAETECY